MQPSIFFLGPGTHTFWLYCFEHPSLDIIPQGLQCSSFFACDLLSAYRDYDILPKMEPHWSPGACMYISKHTRMIFYIVILYMLLGI